VLTFTIDNRGGADDALVEVTTNAARQVDLHTVRSSVMRSVDEVVLSAGASKRFMPSASHVMLIDTTKALTPGSAVDVELRFALSAPITVRVPVEA
jgi:copper(I)-binding protein